MRSTETDEALLTHVHLAREEINEIVRGFVSAAGNAANPEKTIYVLDAPPDPFA